MGKNHITPPWTPEQVEALNWYQTRSGWHPFTCGSAQYCGEGLLDNGLRAPYTTLIATRDGWVCPRCDYTQDWAYELMLHTGPPLGTEAFEE